MHYECSQPSNSWTPSWRPRVRAHQRFSASSPCAQSGELAAARGAADRAHTELQAVRAAADRARADAQAKAEAMRERMQEHRRQCADAHAKLEGARAMVAQQQTWAQDAAGSLAELGAEVKKRGDSAAAAREEASSLSTRLAASAKVRRAWLPSVRVAIIRHHAGGVCLSN